MCHEDYWRVVRELRFQSHLLGDICCKFKLRFSNYLYYLSGSDLAKGRSPLSPPWLCPSLVVLILKSNPF